MSGCEEEKSASLFDPSAPTLSNPTITSVLPAGSAVAGIDTVTVQGTGFSPVLSNNFVVFNSETAQLVHATSTEIKLIAPLVVSDSIKLRVSVHGSYEFSNTYNYILKPAVAEFGYLDSIAISSAVTTDQDGNLYGGFSIAGTDAGVLKITPSGIRSNYAPKTSGNSWTSLKMGPGGYLYAVRNVNAIFRFAPGGGAYAPIWLVRPKGNLFFDIDFDQSGNLWGGGKNINIYRISRDSSAASFPFTGEIHSLRVFEGYLYFAAKTDAGEKIWRAQITTDGLGTPEIYFDFSSAFPQNIPLAITFSSDGNLYIGVDSEIGIIVVTPGKTFTTPLSVYKKLFGHGVKSITWGKDDDMYCSTVDGIFLKIYVTGKTSAPYYGAIL